MNVSCQVLFFLISAQEGRRNFFVQKNVCNSQIYTKVMKKQKTYVLISREYCEINRFFATCCSKIAFSQFFRKISILGHMLLHNSNMNVAITDILRCRKSLYDLPGPKLKNWSRCDKLKMGVVIFDMFLTI